MRGACLAANGGFFKIGVFMEPSQQRWDIEEVKDGVNSWNQLEKMWSAS